MNDLIPSVNPNEGGDERFANKQTGDESGEHSDKDFAPLNGDKGRKPESILAVTLLVALIEVGVLIFWQFADGATGYLRVFFHWMSFNCLVGGLIPIVLKIAGRKWWIWVSFSVVCVILFWPTFVVWRPVIASIPPIAPPFSAKISWGSSSAPEGPQEWYVFSTTRTHVYGSYLVNFTNLTTEPMMVDSYEMEYPDKDGAWQQANISFFLGSAQIYSFYPPNNLTNGKERMYGTLEAAFSNKMIAPNETVRGWVFICKYVELRGQRFGVPIQRMTITTSTGKILTEPTGYLGATGWSFQPILMGSGTNTRDISGLTETK